MPFGARLVPGGVTFRLWAPGARLAEVALDRGSAPPEIHPAEADAEGWWECHVPGAAAGTLYRWRIDGGQLVPDPASRENPQGPHGASCVVDPLQFTWDDGWNGRPWTETVLYELHVGTFTTEGTFAAAAGRLRHLVDTGITAVELMPVANFAGRFGWGYDGVLPYAPHDAYGTPDELKHFVQQAHRLGLMVFLDVVYNHFGPDGNYLNAYAPGFFSRTHASPWGPAINFDGPDSAAVREFFIHNALYWLQEYRFDGLRLDAVHAIRDDSPVHILQELSQRVREAVGAGTCTWCWRTRTTATRTSRPRRGRAASTRSGTTTSTTRCTWRSRARPSATTTTTARRPSTSSAAPSRTACCSRHRRARRAARASGSCRRRPRC